MPFDLIRSGGFGGGRRDDRDRRGGGYGGGGRDDRSRDRDRSKIDYFHNKYISQCCIVITYLKLFHLLGCNRRDDRRNDY